jgi:hypothetical protein
VCPSAAVTADAPAQPDASYSNNHFHRRHSAPPEHYAICLCETIRDLLATGGVLGCCESSSRPQGEIGTTSTRRRDGVLRSDVTDGATAPVNVLRYHRDVSGWVRTQDDRAFSTAVRPAVGN